MNRLILAAALSLTAAAIHAAPVRIATEGDYPPFNLVDDSGQLAGFDVDLGNALCERAALECVWVKNDWDSIIPNLVSGNYDVIMAGMSVLPERKQVISFSEPYFPAEMSSYAALDDGVDLSGVISVQAATVQADHIAETDATMVEFTTLGDAVAAVRNGESDAVFADKVALAPIVDEANSGLVWVGDEIALDEGIAMGLRQSDTELMATLNEALAAMKADGSLNALIKQHFGEDAAGF